MTDKLVERSPLDDMRRAFQLFDVHGTGKLDLPALRKVRAGHGTSQGYQRDPSWAVGAQRLCSDGWQLKAVVLQLAAELTAFCLVVQPTIRVQLITGARTPNTGCSVEQVIFTSHRDHGIADAATAHASTSAAAACTGAMAAGAADWGALGKASLG